ncbi:MAG: hypothetical protein N2V78_02000 [Methanophagales archaeon]|nr:hypothetical protein [Methanophagales archaeon]
MAEEIIRDNCKELDIEVIDIRTCVRGIYGRLPVIIKLLRKVLSKTLRNQWGMGGKWCNNSIV